jgi:hypothetical protein
MLSRMWRRLPKLFWIGLGLLLAGTGPLFTLVVAADLGLTRDPNPNPIGFGMLAGLTFWPAVILIIAGLFKAARRRESGATAPK